MAITTVIGIVIGLGCTIITIVMGGDLGQFIDGGSLFIVIGGVIGSTVASYSGEELKGMLKGFKVAYSKSKTDIPGVIDLILQLANTARREGLLALESSTDSIENRYLKKGIMLIVDGTDPELVKNILETESAYIQDRHANTIGVLASMQGYSPAYGMLGTLVGLINMLAYLDDQAMLAPSMAVALVTTFYGVFLANIIFGPVANKLKSYSMTEELECEIIMEGVLSIQNGENPRLIKEKLLAFVSGTESDAIDAKLGGGAGGAKAES
ncbi:MAG: motility protein A [Clostridia bacterium]|nr:motility protein A [Clostridia bacterium]